MLAIAAAYVVLARRFRVLWHPLAIVAAVGSVGVLVSVIADVLFRSDGIGVTAMARRSAIGSFGWAVVIALGVWIARRLFVKADDGRGERSGDR